MVGDARRRGLPTLVVAGRCTSEGEGMAEAGGCDVVSLTERFGSRPAVAETGAGVATATASGWGRPTAETALAPGVPRTPPAGGDGENRRPAGYRVDC